MICRARYIFLLNLEALKVRCNKFIQNCTWFLTSFYINVMVVKDYTFQNGIMRKIYILKPILQNITCFFLYLVKDRRIYFCALDISGGVQSFSLFKSIFPSLETDNCSNWAANSIIGRFKDEFEKYDVLNIQIARPTCIWIPLVISVNLFNNKIAQVWFAPACLLNNEIIFWRP